MASSATTTKPIQRVLDPTKMGTWNFIRRPPIAKGTVIQGRPRAPNSNAFKEHQFREGVRVQNALKYLTHGRNLFVYHNLRTNQVVYSLTRYLEKNHVLSQLPYHGKKTVPATLRKDIWIPYYSVHFNDPNTGIRAYHLLREFSMQRQLDPPREMITMTKDFLDNRRPRDPEAAREFDEEYNNKVGWIMKKKDRARAVMNQKATSVADIAAVLGIVEQRTSQESEEKKAQAGTKAGQRRQRAAERKKKEYERRVAMRVTSLEQLLSNPREQVKIEMPKDNEEGKSNEVKILWNDIQDARYTESWPERVRHGELEQSRDHVIAGQRNPRYITEAPFQEKGEQ
ncbi:hypothetical protein PHISP_00536 [Aspergillus sp. HF37]|nr:hypothetical protein PHISP_00536 [Aspergillus sp. HF37]